MLNHLLDLKPCTENVHSFVTLLSRWLPLVRFLLFKDIFHRNCRLLVRDVLPTVLRTFNFSKYVRYLLWMLENSTIILQLKDVFCRLLFGAMNNICPGQRFFCHVISLQYLCRFLVSDVPPTECEEELRFEHGFGISFCKC